MLNRAQLRPYQKAAIEFSKANKRFAFFIDPGLGKTVSTLTAMTDLMDDFACGMTLIVAPPRVAYKTWPDEFKNWKHLAGFSFVAIQGTPKKRQQLLRRKACFHTISFDLLPWLLEQLGGTAKNARKAKVALEAGDTDTAKAHSRWRPPTAMPYTTIIVDESTWVKSHKSNRFRALSLMAARAERVGILTGTPAANGYYDLWAQIYLLDGGERLGKNITAFRRRWFRQNFSGFGYRIKKQAEAAVKEAIEDITFTLREADYADLPARLYNDIKVDFDAATQAKYKELERKYILEVNENKEIRVDSGAAVMMKLQQLANGVVYDEEGNPHTLHNLKLDALMALHQELNGNPLLVAYQFQTDRDRILAAVKGARVLDKNPETQDAWNAGEIPMLLMHPRSGAHGLNLQKGGHNIAWYGLTWSLESYIQLNKRLHRSGQKKPVMIHHIMANSTVDDDVLSALENKDSKQEALLNALKKRIEIYV